MLMINIMKTKGNIEHNTFSSRKWVLCLWKYFGQYRFEYVDVEHISRDYFNFCHVESHGFFSDFNMNQIILHVEEIYKSLSLTQVKCR